MDNQNNGSNQAFGQDTNTQPSQQPQQGQAQPQQPMQPPQQIPQQPVQPQQQMPPQPPQQTQPPQQWQQQPVQPQPLQPAASSRRQKKQQEIQGIVNSYNQQLADGEHVPVPPNLLLHKKILGYLSIFSGASLVIFGLIYALVESFVSDLLAVFVIGPILLLLGVMLIKESRLMYVERIMNYMWLAHISTLFFAAALPLVALLDIGSFVYLVVLNVMVFIYKMRNKIRFPFGLGIK